MNGRTNDEQEVRARIPADLDTPDQIMAGLTARQLTILLAAAAPVYGLWRAAGTRIPLPVLAAIGAPIAALAVCLALGRRDGISLERWVLAAATGWAQRRRLAPAPPGGFADPPAWAPPDTGPTHRPVPLRLGVQAIRPDGVISTGPGTATALVAASTVTAGLHTPAEQAVLLGGFTRWLHALAGPVQIVVSTRRDDLTARALHVAENAHDLDPALARAAIGHAEFLLDLSEADPRTRTVTIACTATAAGSDATTRTTAAGDEARRRAARTVSGLGALGSRCTVLDAGQVTAVLTAATDPFGPTDVSWPRTPPTGVVTTADPPTHDDGQDDDGDGGWDDQDDQDDTDGGDGDPGCRDTGADGDDSDDGWDDDWSEHDDWTQDDEDWTDGDTGWHDGDPGWDDGDPGWAVGDPGRSEGDENLPGRESARSVSEDRRAGEGVSARQRAAGPRRGGRSRGERWGSR